MSQIHRFLLFLSPLVLLLAEGTAAGTMGSRLQKVLSTSNPTDRIVAWVFFSDKGIHELKKEGLAQNLVTPRALQRRRNVLPASALVDYSDLPVVEQYVSSIASMGVQVRERTKWLNGISISATREQIEAVNRLPFVQNVDLVAQFRRDPVRLGVAEVVPHQALSRLQSPGSGQSLDYGSSLPQVGLLDIPAVHNLGNHAEDVVIGVFDNGFRLPNHEALKGLQIIATHDFVDRKTSVVPNNPDPSYGSHGTHVLSTLAGYKPGALIGPAYGAKFILARTENDSSETPAEEDKWVAAIEWAESLGVQVTSTSLGYLDYNFPFESWTWQDMDGKTTVISRAAAMAATKGVVVVNSAGNNGANASHNTLDAPADADGILTVGAVTPTGSRASFSSVGPTTSSPPRIKPDVMATGTTILHASSVDTTGYALSQGTSFACPLASGIAALLVHAHPEASPDMIIDALKLTANNASSPDNFMGWGIISARLALDRLGSLQKERAAEILSTNFPNPFPSLFNPSTRIAYTLPEDASVTLRIYDLLGQEVRTLVIANESAGMHLATWDGKTADGIPVASGAYFYRLDVRGVSGSVMNLVKKLLVVR